PRRGLDAMIGGGAADDERGDAARPQARLEISADKGAVDALDDHGLAGTFARFVLDGIAGAVGPERRVRPRALVANVEDGYTAFAKSGEETDDPRHRLRIVAPLAGGLPFVEGALDIDDDEGGVEGH